MAKFQYMPLYTAAFFHETILFDNSETGAYISLLCYQWAYEKIPSDKKSIRKITKTPHTKLKEVLKKFILTEDGFYQNKTLKDKYDEFVKKKKRKEANDFCREVRSVLINENTECVICGSKKRLAIDHIIPISKGGENHLDNIQVLCHSCNSKKGGSV